MQNAAKKLERVVLDAVADGRADLSPRANCGVAREKPIRLVRYKNAVPRVLF